MAARSKRVETETTTKSVSTKSASEPRVTKKKVAKKKVTKKKATSSKASAPKGTRAKSSTNVEFDHDAIAQRAYQIFERRGGRHGQDAQDWNQAIVELEAEAMTSARS